MTSPHDCDGEIGHQRPQGSKPRNIFRRGQLLALTDVAYSRRPSAGALRAKARLPRPIVPHLAMHALPPGAPKCQKQFLSHVPIFVD